MYQHLGNIIMNITTNTTHILLENVDEFNKYLCLWIDEITPTFPSLNVQ